MFWMDGLLDADTRQAIRIGQSAVGTSLGTPSALGAQAGDFAIVADFNGGGATPLAGWTPYQIFPGSNAYNIYTKQLSSGDLSSPVSAPGGLAAQLIVYRYATSLRVLVADISTGPGGYTLAGVSPSPNNIGLFGATHNNTVGASIISPATWTDRGTGAYSGGGRAIWSDRLGLPAYAGEGFTISSGSPSATSRHTTIFEFLS